MFSSSRFYPCVPSPWIRCKTPQWTDWMLVQTFSSNAVFHTASLLSEDTPPVPASRGRKTSLVRQMFTHLRHTHGWDITSRPQQSISQQISVQNDKIGNVWIRTYKEIKPYITVLVKCGKETVICKSKNFVTILIMFALCIFLYLFFTKTARGSPLVQRKSLKLSSHGALKTHTTCFQVIVWVFFFLN